MISSSHLDLIENVLEDQHYSSALNLIYALSGCSQSQSKSFAGHLLDTLNTGSTLLPEAAAVLRLLIQSNNLVSLQELLQYQKDASPERSSVWKLILNSWTVWETSLTEDSSNESGSMFSGRGIHKMLVERIEREISECEDVKQCSLMGKGQRLSRKQLATNFQSLLSSMLEADVADPEVIPTAAKWIYQYHRICELSQDGSGELRRDLVSIMRKMPASRITELIECLYPSELRLAIVDQYLCQIANLGKKAPQLFKNFRAHGTDEHFQEIASLLAGCKPFDDNDWESLLFMSQIVLLSHPSISTTKGESAYSELAENAPSTISSNFRISQLFD